MLVPLLPFVVHAMLASAILPAPDTTRYSPEDVVRELPSLVLVTSSRPGFYALELDTAGAQGALGALARANRHYVLYLTLNAPSAPLSRATMRGTVAAVRQNVLRRLVADTVYLQILAQSVDRHRISARGAVAPRPAPAALRPVRVNRVLDVASRFFYPEAVLPDGRIQAYVCVGINGVIDMQGGRDLALEAFAYAAIFHDLLAPRYGIDADFQEAKRLVNTMDLSSNAATRLQRAQGVMWAFMLRSERLRQVLAAEYARAQAYLPFRIEGSLAPATIAPTS